LKIFGTLKTFEGSFLKIIEILPINHSLHLFNAQFDAFASQGLQYFISEASRALKTLFKKNHLLMTFHLPRCVEVDVHYKKSYSLTPQKLLKLFLRSS
jgi:hypothetical protein